MPDFIDLSETPNTSPKPGDSNHERSRSAERQDGGEINTKPLDMRDAGPEFKMPDSPTARRTAINDVAKARVEAEGVPTAQAKTLTDKDGTKIEGTMETRPDGRQFFNQVKPDGTGVRSEVFTDHQGRQTLQPVDSNDRVIKTAATTYLQSDAPPAAPVKDNHQQLALDTTGGTTKIVAPDKTAVVEPVPVVDQANRGLPQRDQGQAVVPVVAKEQLQPAPVANDVVNPNPPVQGFQPGRSDQIRPVVQTAPVIDSNVPAKPAVNSELVKSSSQPHGFEQYRPAAETNPAARPVENRPGGAQDTVNPVVRPNQGEVPGATARPLEPGKAPEQVKPLDSARPVDALKPGQNLSPEALNQRNAVLQAHEAGLKAMQVDGKLLAQLQTLGRSPEARAQLADILSRFQEGKLLTGKEAVFTDMLKGMRPEQINGLNAWLKDGINRPFDFKQLDMRTQQDLSKVFDSVMGRSLGGDRGAGRLLEFLSGDKGGRFDRVPGAEQSRVLMLELFKGMRDTQLAAGRDIPGLKDAVLLSRTLGGERGNTEFRLNLKDLGPIGQLLLDRLQNKDMLALMNTSSERSGFISRMDGRELAFGQFKDQSGIKELGQMKDLAMPLRELAGREDGRPVLKLNEAVKELVSKTEPGRSLGGKEAGAALADAQTLTGRSQADLDTAKQRLDQQNTAGTDISGKTTQQQEQEEAKRRKAEKDKEEELLEEERLAKELKERQDREERERKLRLEKEEEERKKKEENAKNDNEYTYVVRKGDTLKSIAARQLKNAAFAEIIYDRNKGSIMISNYQGKQYARLFPDQKLTIPNRKYIQDFKSSFKSHKGIGFDRIPYASAEEELQAVLGMSAEGGKAAGGLLGKRLFADDGEQKPVNRRSFSGKSNLSDEERRANVQSVLGQSSKADEQKYTVKLGEGLRSIAQKLYDKPSYWRLLAYKNGMSFDLDAKGNPLAQLKRGDQLVLPAGEELDAFDEDPEAFLRGDYGIESRMAPIELQELEISDSQEPSYQAKNESAPAQDSFDAKPDSSTAFAPETNAAIDPAAVPDANSEEAADQSRTIVSDLSKGQRLAKSSQIEQAHSDMHWHEIAEPEILDDFVQIREAEISHNQMQGVCVSMQMLAGGSWHSVYEYQIFEDECYIVQYRRSGERVGSTRKSLQAKQAKQMAKNHFRSAWQSICREFWRS